MAHDVAGTGPYHLFPLSGGNDVGGVCTASVCGVMADPRFSPDVNAALDALHQEVPDAELTVEPSRTGWTVKAHYGRRLLASRTVVR